MVDSIDKDKWEVIVLQCMNGKTIKRSTKVVSVSLDNTTYTLLQKLIRETSQSTSSLIASLIRKKSFEESWGQIRQWGSVSAKKLKLTSEEDVYKLLGDA